MRHANLDLLRLTAAFMVLIFHFGFRMEITGEGGGIHFSELRPIAMWCDIGLLIFFTISGYVITMSTDNRSAIDFAVGRIARIWPIFVTCATITATVLYCFPVSGLQIPTLVQWLSHFIIVSRLLGQPFLDGAYWTIAVELIFYGWVFLLIALGWFQKQWKVFTVVWIFLSVANEFIFDSEAIRKLLITEYSGYFAFGIGLYRSAQSIDSSTMMVMAVAVLWACAAPFVINDQIYHLYHVNRSVIGLGLMGPIALACFTLCVKSPDIMSKNGVAVMLGALTYPLYLLHQNIGYSVFTHFADMQNRWFVFAIFLSILLIICWFIVRFIDRPIKATVFKVAYKIVDLMRPHLIKQNRL